MHPFDVGSIREADLTALVDARAAESRTLEFKLQLPQKSDGDRKEFLADVTSFANAQGGVILYGVGTARDQRGSDTGVAEALPGLPGLVPDQEVQRLESMLRDGIDPSLTAQVRFQAIAPASGSPPILAVGVFRSYAGPHQVTYAGSRRFWLRGQTGKYEPDVTELRRLFVSAASWLGQADEIRIARLELLRARPAVDLESITLVQILPLAPPETLFDLVAHEARLRDCRPLQSDGWSHRFNTDGFTTYTPHYQSQKIISYTQWLRTGGVEGFSAGFAGERDFSGPKPVKVIWIREMRSAVLEWAGQVTSVLRDPLRVEPPYVVLLTVGGVLGARIPVSHGGFSSHTVDRDDLLLPPVLFEPGKAALAEILQPLFDTIAQSAGLATAPR